MSSSSSQSRTRKPRSSKSRYSSNSTHAKTRRLESSSRSSLNFDEKELFAIFKLIFHASKGDINGMKESLKIVDVNLGDYDRRTALHLASAEGKLNAVKFLVENGAVVNAEDRWGGTPLQDAMASKHDDVAQFLRESGASILNKAVLADKICLACSAGDLPLVKRLYENGADLNHTDYDGRTPLHIAASEGHVFVVEFLADNGADLNQTDRWGGTPLLDAINHKHDTVVAYLKSQGAQLIDKGKVGDVVCSAASKGDLAVLQRLVKAGVSLEVADYDKRTPLHLAAASGFLNVVEFLVDSKCSINAQDRWKGTPLADALRHEHSKIAEYLKSKGALVIESSAIELEIASKYLVQQQKKQATQLKLSTLKAYSTPNIIKELIRELNNSNSVIVCLEALLEKVEADRSTIMAHEGDELLSGVLQSYRHEESIIQLVSQIIEEICVDDGDTVKFCKHGVLRILFDILQKSEDASTHQHVLSCLSAITFINPETKSKNPESIDVIAKGFSHESGIGVVLAALHRVSSNPVAVKRAIQTLWHAGALDKTNVERLVRAGGVEKINDVWKHSMRNADIVHACSGSMRTLILESSEASQIFVLNCYGVQRIIDTIREHSNDAEIVLMLLHILSKLTTNYQPSAKTANSERGFSMPRVFVEKKGAATLIHAMKKYSNHQLLNEYAAISLMNMAKASNAEGLKSPTLEKHGAKAVSNAAKKHKNSDNLVLIDRELKMMKGCIIM